MDRELTEILAEAGGIYRDEIAAGRVSPHFGHLTDPLAKDTFDGLLMDARAVIAAKVGLDVDAITSVGLGVPVAQGDGSMLFTLQVKV